MPRTGRAMVFTDRQREVIRLLAEGCSNAEIARKLGVTDRTAKAHCDTLRTKLGVTRRRYIPIAYRSTTGEDPLAEAETPQLRQLGQGAGMLHVRG
jgi:DNA-binding CsgD family transcriptional regulator